MSRVISSRWMLLERTLSKRIIITKAPLKEGWGQKFFLAAAFDEKRMTQIQVEAVSKSSILGNIYIGRVENIATNIQAAFVNIAKGVSCFLPLEEAKNAVFTKKNGKKDLCIGDELLVEVTREKQKNKPASVSANLNFSGKYLILTTGNHLLGISKKLHATERERLQALLKDQITDTFGIVVRTAAKDASDEEILKELEMLKGYVHSLESFGSVDGPGVRYVIFLSGCAMRCQFCHNPDTWNMTDGKEYTTDQLLKTALRFKSYWGDKGGITVSGGEPLLQMDFLTELFRKAKEAGVHTTLDTSGNPYTTKEPWHSKWLELMKYTDILLLDIKQINEQEHVKLTGQTNANILAMARELSDMGKPVWIRHVLVPGGSDKDEYLHQLADFIHTLKNVERVEVLPYHTLGIFKWEKLGIPYPLEGVKPPTQERIDNARRILGAI